MLVVNSVGGLHIWLFRHRTCILGVLKWTSLSQELDGSKVPLFPTSHAECGVLSPQKLGRFDLHLFPSNSSALWPNQVEPKSFHFNLSIVHEALCMVYF